MTARAAGAEIVDYPLKTACCGGAHTLSDSDTSTKLVTNLIEAADECGADVIATSAQRHSGLEMHQIRAETRFGKKTNAKIVYFTQLLGLALGLSARKVEIHENVSDSLGYFKEKGVHDLFEDIFTGIEQAGTDDDTVNGVTAMLGWGEYILENWIEAQGQKATNRNAKALGYWRSIDKVREVIRALMPAGDLS